ncbi:CRTAC1 family protein [Wenzhouxiangella sp. XN79A]|uniref:CRTAC1 family protein n=1 Tax=Wenzhouxiangella sp. XN79A TaxID=2724193 RepID=UPI00144A69C6|nr:CRTAC1 family protein [Wenzhouxiangella sp. XN79A]NKI33997.1 CRTAC1 family protein [Wenzhouxiangella sp. XN79A]
MIRRAPALVMLATVAPAMAGGWGFVEVTATAAPPFSLQQQFGPLSMADYMAGGLAAGDLDGDGRVDLVIPRGDFLAVRVLINQGDGSFADRATDWGLGTAAAGESIYAIGATLADLDGDGRRDLLLPGIRGYGLRVYRNLGDRFKDATALFALGNPGPDFYSVAVGDADGDGRLDLATAHWGSGSAPLDPGHLWLQRDDGFVASGQAWGLAPTFAQPDSGGDFTFTPNFADLDGDGDADLTMAGDFLTSQYFHNDNGARFIARTDAEITDENGMGAAIGDFDGDGHLDWFVTAIHDEDPPPNLGQGGSGNRLYRNDGTGRFVDVTEAAGVRDGGWGWGACAADFDLDGDLDLFHVNGWNVPNSEFTDEPARLFVNDGSGAFTEQAELRNIADTSEGRGIACFDVERDGDIDVVVQVNQGPGRIFLNTAADAGDRRWLGLILRGRSPNTESLGARIRVTAGGRTQVHEMQIPVHYLSTSPAEHVFGLAPGGDPVQVDVRWPDGETARYRTARTQRWLVLAQRGVDDLFTDGFEPPAAPDGTGSED